MLIEGGQNIVHEEITPAAAEAPLEIAAPAAHYQELRLAAATVVSRTVFGAALEGHPNELWR